MLHSLALNKELKVKLKQESEERGRQYERA